MTPPNAATHTERMKSLVEFTRTSLGTEFPSPFGSSIYELASGELIAEAYDTVIHQCDPTNHAEMNAIRLATRKLGRLSLAGHILYSTCEPCPMCMSGAIWAEVDAVVFGTSTMEDADAYWPQASDLSPDELVAHMCREAKCVVVPHVQRALCQQLFRDASEVIEQRKLRLPPHR